ncbi:MAG: restriction endonuclease subunit S domain-containing protein, partial [Planctomycetota bacterium]
YYNQPSKEEEKLSILSGATVKANLMGYISRNARPNGRALKVFSGPAILVVRKGIAGQMTYISREEFTTNDDAYVLARKQNWKAKVNLLWFIHEYQHLFFNLVTSKSDNATFNKEYALRQLLKIPDDIDCQDRFGKKIQAIEFILENHKEIERKIGTELRYALI